MTENEARLWCVVPAAGRGSRFGGSIPKQYVTIAGRPLLNWTIETLAAHPRVAGLMVVLAADDVHWMPIETVSEKPVLTCVGGGERADSVLAGLQALPSSVQLQDFVLVHDAARPCVRAADIDSLIERGMQADGALLAAPLRDTLKRAGSDQRVVATEPRDSRWRALTPQLFRRAELVDALHRARTAGIAVTDEAMAMELAGFHPLLVEGSEDNLKVTTATDRDLAEYLLGTRR